MDESEQTLGDSEGQGSLVCCNPWGHKESDATWRPNNDNNKETDHLFNHLSADEHLGCFHLLSILNNVTIKF